MTLAFLFWLVMLAWLLFSVAGARGTNLKANWQPLSQSLLTYILFVILGWAQFGAPIH